LVDIPSEATVKPLKIFQKPTKTKVSGFEFASPFPSLSPQTRLSPVFWTADSACSGSSSGGFNVLQWRNYTIL